MELEDKVKALEKKYFSTVFDLETKHNSKLSDLQNDCDIWMGKAIILGAESRKAAGYNNSDEMESQGTTHHPPSKKRAGAEPKSKDSAKKVKGVVEVSSHYKCTHGTKKLTFVQKSTRKAQTKRGTGLQESVGSPFLGETTQDT